MLIPSIDLQDGAVVQLVQGERLAIRDADVFAWVKRFARFPKVQVIDLDAAMGAGDNLALVRQIAASLSCRVGGGVRTIERAQDILGAGARQVIVGSSLFKAGRPDLDFAKRLADAIGVERVIAAVDSKGGHVVIHGWKTALPLTALDAVHALEPYCGEFLYTHVDAEGLMGGTNLEAILALRNATTRRLTAAGGITTREEIDTLDAQSVDSVVGMALYTGSSQSTEWWSFSVRRSRSSSTFVVRRSSNVTAYGELTNDERRTDENDTRAGASRSYFTVRAPRSIHFRVHPRPFPVDLFSGGAEAGQNGLGQRQRHLPLSGKHLIGAGLAQRVALLQVRGARQNLHLRIELPDEANRLFGRAHARHGEDHAARVTRAGLLERRQMTGVAVDRADARVLEILDRVHVELDDGRRDLVLAQQPGHRPPDRSVADDHRLMAADGGRRRLRVRRQLSVADAGPPRRHRVDQPVEQRIERDRGDGARDERVGRGRRTSRRETRRGWRR